MYKVTTIFVKYYKILHTKLNCSIKVLVFMLKTITDYSNKRTKEEKQLFCLFNLMTRTRCSVEE